MDRKKKNLVASDSGNRRWNGLWIAMIVVGVGLKIGLLATSQSMPDGDEAVEGLMAMHINSKGVHPIYPYGVNYGAGAGWEAHLAAILFLIFGTSTVALKSVGMLHFLITVALVGVIGRILRGKDAGLMAAALFAIAPQTAQWALKVGGGHQVAIVLGLGGLACLLAGKRIAALGLLPLAALAHPIVLPFSAVLCVGILATERTWRGRLIHMVSLVGFAGIEFLLLRPPSNTVWNPVSTSFEWGVRLVALPRLFVGLFCPNLNSTLFPLDFDGLVGGIWLFVFVLSVFRKSQPRWNQVALLGTAGILLIVRSYELAPRHLLMASPLAVIAIVCASPLVQSGSRILPLVLGVLGGIVHVGAMSDPCIYGPGPQSAGVNRENFGSVMSKLQEQKIHHVYCFDAMLQWNIDFASRETVIARWMSPEDRVPEYVRAVDEAFRSGERIGVVAPMNRSIPPKYMLITDMVPRIVHEYFPIVPQKPVAETAK